MVGKQVQLVMVAVTADWRWLVISMQSEGGARSQKLQV